MSIKPPAKPQMICATECAPAKSRAAITQPPATHMSANNGRMSNMEKWETFTKKPNSAPTPVACRAYFIKIIGERHKD
jgi:hypothetical protein